MGVYFRKWAYRFCLCLVCTKFHEINSKKFGSSPAWAAGEVIGKVIFNIWPITACHSGWLSWRILHYSIGVCFCFWLWGIFESLLFLDYNAISIKSKNFTYSPLNLKYLDVCEFQEMCLLFHHLKNHTKINEVYCQTMCRC